jgi:hypothetical protein
MKRTEGKKVIFLTGESVDIPCVLSKLVPLALIVTGIGLGQKSCTSSLGCSMWPWGRTGWPARLTRFRAILLKHFALELFWEYTVSIDRVRLPVKMKEGRTTHPLNWALVNRALVNGPALAGKGALLFKLSEPLPLYVCLWCQPPTDILWF